MPYRIEIPGQGTYEVESEADAMKLMDSYAKPKTEDKGTGITESGAPAVAKQGITKEADDQSLIQDVADTYKKFQSVNQYFSKKAAEGFTMDLYEVPPEEIPNDELSRSIGKAGYLTGLALNTYVGGLAGRTLLRAIPGAEKLVKAGVAAKDQIKQLKILKTAAQASEAVEDVKKIKNVLNAARLASAKGTAATIASEGATVGGVLGAARGVQEAIKDDESPMQAIKTIALNAATDAAMLTVGGLAVAPVVAGAGKLFGRRKAILSKKATEAIAGNKTAKALAQMSPDETIAALGEAVSKGTATPEQRAAYNTYTKINELPIEISGPTKLLSNPALLSEMGKDEAAKVSRSLFLDEGGILNKLYNSDRGLKQLVDTGEHVEALRMVQNNLVSELKSNATFRDYLMSPLANDAETAAQVVKDRLASLQKKQLKKASGEKVAGFLLDPATATPDALAEAKISEKGLSRAQKRVLDPMLKPQEVDYIVGNALDKMFTSIANSKSPGLSGAIVKDLPKTEGLLKAMFAFNKSFTDKAIDGYMEHSAARNFIDLPENLRVNDKAIVNNAIKLKQSKMELARLYEDRRELASVLKQADKPSAQSVKIDYQRKSSQIRNVVKRINEIENSLRDLPEATRKSMDDFVSKVYVTPSEFSDQVLKTSQSMQPFDTGKTNPYYLRKDSELAKVMQMYSASGMDINKPTIRNYFVNKRRALDIDLGPDNAVSRFFDDIKLAESAKNKEARLWKDQINGLGIKAGSKEDKVLFDLIENPSTVNSEEFLSLDAKTQEKLKKASTGAKEIFSVLFTKMNQVLAENGLPQIQFKENYIHHYQTAASLLGDLQDMVLRGASKEEIEKEFGSIGLKYKQRNSVLDPNRTFAAFELRRTGDEKFEKSVIGSLENYIEPALDRIHLTPYLRQIDAAKEFAPVNLGKMLQDVKETALLKRPGDQSLREKGLGKTIKALSAIRNMRSAATLAYNARSVINQITSMPLNFVASPANGLKAIVKRGTKEAQEAIALSSNLELRDIAKFEGFEGGVVSKAIKGLSRGKVDAPATFKRAEQAFEKAGFWAMQALDKEAATHAYLTGYYKGIDMGLSPKAAARMGDRLADQIHNSMAKIDQPEFYNTALGKTAGQFMSFSTNLMTTIFNDLPNQAFTDGTAKTVQTIMRAYAASTYANELADEMGIPKPFDMGTFVPFLSDFKFDSDALSMGAASFIKALSKSSSGDTKEAKQLFKKAEREAYSGIIPGFGQARKIKEAYKKDKNNVKAYLFGPSAIKRAREERAMEQRSSQEKTRKFFKKKVKETLFKGG